MSPVRLGKRFATGHRGDLSAAMVCREMCCEIKNLARDAYLYPHRKCVYKSAADPGGSALARAPPLDRGRTLARLVITITDKGEKEPVSNYYDKRHGYGGVRGGTCGRLLR